MLKGDRRPRREKVEQAQARMGRKGAGQQGKRRTTDGEGKHIGKKGIRLNAILKSITDRVKELFGGARRRPWQG